jgi:hypothetical protein
VERRQADSLFLIVKRNRPHNAWQFPQGKLQPNENFRAVSSGWHVTLFLTRFFFDFAYCCSGNEKIDRLRSGILTFPYVPVS